MEDPRFYGTYARFEAPRNDDASMLMGRDNIVGDAYEVVIKHESGHTRAWMHNRFGADVAYFDEETSYRLQVLLAQDKTVKAILSFVALTEQEDGSRQFWGECAIVAYDQRYSSEFEVFTSKLCDKLSESVRPDLEITTAGIDQIISKKGNWLPERTIPLPDRSNHDFALVKESRSVGDKLVEQARKNNIGCYIFGYGAIALFLVAIFFAVKGLLGF